MKICFICNEYPPSMHGGIGVIVRLVGREMVARGHEVRVVGVYSDLDDAPSYEEDHGVRVWRIRGAGRPFSVFHDRYGLHRLVADWARRGEIDVVESPDYEGQTAFWPALSCPTVVRLHGSGVYFAQETNVKYCKKAYLFESAALKHADFICSSSEYTARRTFEVFNLRRNCTVLYNPLELSGQGATAPGERGSRSVAFTGTLAYKKGVISLVRAWPKVVERFPEATLDIFGKDGKYAGASMQEYLKAELDDAGVLSSVRFHGHVEREQMLQTFDTARAAIFPSYSEAFSMAPMESMVRGCPTIYSTRHSGPELIRDGADGLLVDPDDLAGIADAICRLLGDDALAARLGMAGIDRIRNNFSIPVLAPKFEAYYQECIDQFRRWRCVA